MYAVQLHAIKANENTLREYQWEIQTWVDWNTMEEHTIWINGGKQNKKIGFTTFKTLKWPSE